MGREDLDITETLDREIARLMRQPNRSTRQGVLSVPLSDEFRAVGEKDLGRVMAARKEFCIPTALLQHESSDNEMLGQDNPKEASQLQVPLPI